MRSSFKGHVSAIVTALVTVGIMMPRPDAVASNQFIIHTLKGISITLVLFFMTVTNTGHPPAAEIALATRNFSSDQLRYLHSFGSSNHIDRSPRIISASALSQSDLARKRLRRNSRIYWSRFRVYFQSFLRTTGRVRKELQKIALRIKNDRSLRIHEHLVSL